MTLDLNNVFLLINKYGPTVVAVCTSITSAIHYIQKDVSLAISQADKNNDGVLTNSELEDLAIGILKNSNIPYIKVIPEPLLRFVIDKLCDSRKLRLNVKDIYSLINTSTVNNIEDET